MVFKDDHGVLALVHRPMLCIFQWCGPQGVEMRSITLDAGEVLYREGEDSDSVYYV